MKFLSFAFAVSGLASAASLGAQTTLPIRTGIVAAQHAKLRQKHPLLLAHFERTSRLYQRDPKWRIYSIIPGDKKN